MLKGLKYRLYPTNLQKELIAKHIGSSRFVGPVLFRKSLLLSLINRSFVTSIFFNRKFSTKIINKFIKVKLNLFFLGQNCRVDENYLLFCRK